MVYLTVITSIPRILMVNLQKVQIFLRSTSDPKRKANHFK